ncbi:MAG: SET domain-containing protein-lysine N-methyltransferase [Candidatus Moraniibacteriota bacterium]
MNQPQEKNTLVKVKRSSAGLGLFAIVPIKKGKTIIEYIGERIPTSVGDNRDSRYIFNVSSRIDIDGGARYNTARYINHSCRPNCEAINRRGRIFIVAKKNILAGEELHYNYGKSYFEGLIADACRCIKCYA